jgi:outer membrane protein OmpA-like peptidoglycan-associated protein
MRRILTASLLLFTLRAHAELPTGKLPAYLTLPAEVQPASDDAVQFEEYGEDDFELGAEAATLERGKHWEAGLVLSHAPEDMAGKQVWATIKPALVRGGWQITSESDANPFSVVMRYRKGGKDVVGALSIISTGDLRLRLIEIAPLQNAFVIKPPAAVAEKVSAEDGDFPYLPPLPGSTRTQSARDDVPMLVELKDAEEPQVVASDSILKSYQPQLLTSNIAFVTLYGAALTKAGWTVVSTSQALHQGDANLVAHYAKGDRDLWAMLHTTRSEYQLRVGDPGQEPLAKKLATDCHVALLGVRFDSNKSALKPESSGVLQRIAGVLKADAALQVEVQGHTDNVGDDLHNQSLSEARARSVMAWLISHGISAARLSAKGFGRTHPVASNDEVVGRARNRRVEIAKPGCAGK